MELDRARKHSAFSILSLRDQIIDRIRMIDDRYILGNDRPFIKIRSDIMCGCTHHLDTAFVGSVIGLGAFETWQEAVVDVDHTAVEFAA